MQTTRLLDAELCKKQLELAFEGALLATAAGVKTEADMLAWRSVCQELMKRMECAAQGDELRPWSRRAAGLMFYEVIAAHQPFVQPPKSVGVDRRQFPIALCPRAAKLMRENYISTLHSMDLIL